MGSSAGAGSGEFHVYRHLRRKEYARQKQLQQQSLKVTLSSHVDFDTHSLQIAMMFLFDFLGANGR